MDLGFATHGVHMDQRLVQLTATLSSSRTTLVVQAPPNGKIYPPGPGYLYVVTNSGVPSFGHRTLIGTGASPPVDEGAITKYVACHNGSAYATNIFMQHARKHSWTQH